MVGGEDVSVADEAPAAGILQPHHPGILVGGGVRPADDAVLGGLGLVLNAANTGGVSAGLHLKKKWSMAAAIALPSLCTVIGQVLLLSAQK